MDAEWAAMAAPGVPVHTTRIKLPKVTVEDRGVDRLAGRAVGDIPL